MTEVRVHGFRIDAVSEDGELIEIQHASLGALRDKTRKLLAAKGKPRVRIVKPIVRRKRVTTLCKKTGAVVRSRMSPKTCDWMEIFMDLVHFSTVFPKQGLTLEIVLIDAEEIRVDCVPRHRRAKTYKSMDIRLLEVTESIELTTTEELVERLRLGELASPFDTQQLGVVIGKPRWFAQKVAYCLRQMNAIKQSGKRGNSRLYDLKPRTKPKKRSSSKPRAA